MQQQQQQQQQELVDEHHCLFTVSVYAMTASALFVAIGLFYALYLYVEIDAIKLALFILIVSIAASVWELACSYNKYPPVVPRVITTTTSSWHETHTCNSYQISPEGIRTSCNDIAFPTLEESPKKKGSMGRRAQKAVVEECILVKITIAVIRIFYGEGEKRCALIHKSVVEYDEENGPLYNAQVIAHKYNGDHNRLRYPYPGPVDMTNEEGGALIDSLHIVYNKKRPFVTVREDREYSTGHRIVRQMKMRPK
jgi:hypothetical protein